MNVSVSSVKFNLSENKIQMIIHFLNLLLLMYQQNVEKYDSNFKQYVFKKSYNKMIMSMKELKNVQRSVCLLSVVTLQNKFTPITKELLTNTVQKQKLDR